VRELDILLRRFGAPIEVITDQGIKFQGDFQDLCEKTLIDYWVASRGHP
jgi:hypothetical protein